MALNQTQNLRDEVIFNFSDPDLTHYWTSRDDRVMGGRSSSRLMPIERWAAFTGIVRGDSGGGFASVSSGALELDLHCYDAMALRVRGDGRSYGFVIRCGDPLRASFRYQIPFYTGASRKWQTVMLPFDQFKPMVLGSALPMAPRINPAHVTAVGLIIAEKQYGRFQLEIESIEAIATDSRRV